MHSYQSLKKLHGSKVSQTIDEPILIFDFWELSDAFIGLMIVLVFGVLFYSSGLMTALLLLFLAVGPIIKRRNKPGIFFHWPYRKLWIELPGLINPRGQRKYSD